MKHTKQTNRNFRFSSFLTGIVVTVLLLSLTLPALAAGGLTTLQVRLGGIKIVLDGQELHPTDVNGKTVEPMIYNGTTYLPVRAVASALGKAVYWDGPNYTVYLGNMSGKLEYPTVMLKDMMSIGDSPRGTNSLVDNYGNSYSYAVTNDHSSSMHFEYLLNMKYSRFKAVLYVPEGNSKPDSCALTITADGHQLYTSPLMDKTSGPVIIDINVTGYNDFKIDFSTHGNWAQNGFTLCLADAGFYQ